MNGEQHTQGRLHVDQNYTELVNIKCGDDWVAEATSHSTIQLNEANARRLVACWNACQGLSTELLEGITTGGDTLLDRFAQHQKTERELKAQRDQLLEALSQLVKAEQRAANLSFCADTYAQESVRLQIYDAMKAAQAAIAACQPKTTVAHLPSDDTEGGAV